MTDPRPSPVPTGTTRRGFLGAAGAIAAVGALAAAGCSNQAPSGSPSSAAGSASPQAGGSVSVSGPEVHWRCLTSWPKNLTIMHGGAQFVCDRVKELTNGKFTIELFVEGELDTKDDLLTAVSKKFVECSHTSSDYYADKNLALTFGSGAPFGFTADEHAAWLRFGGGMDLMQELYSKFGVKYFPAGNTGEQTGGWFNKEINQLSDFAGLKMRIGGIAADIMKKLGAVPTSVPYLKLAESIKNGTLDAAEFVGPYDDRQLGLEKVAKFYYMPGWWQVGDQLDFICNQEAFDALPKEYQQAIESASWEANGRVLAEYDFRNGDALDQLVAGGTIVKQFPLEMMKQSFQIMEGIHKENCAKSPDYAKVFTSWDGFRRKVKKWHMVNERPVMQANVFGF